MPKRWPPLELREVVAILTALGLSYSHTKGGHDFYKGLRNGKGQRVTVDPKNSPFSDDLLQWMCQQSGASRDEFYNATPGTAVKIAEGKKT